MTLAPYPADTRAKGWRFEIDYERIRQSDTWALSPAEIRPWLLMLWMVAWEQTPCGSLPDDNELIAARIDMPLERFQQVKAKLMRRWWKADDGRLYHDVIVGRVLQMIDSRAKETARKAGYRSRTTPAVPAESRGTDDTGTGTYLSEANASESAQKRASRKCPKSFEVSSELVAFATGLGIDWQTETAKLRDHTFKNAISDWPGTWRNWMRRASENRPVNGETVWQRSQRERVSEMTGGLVSSKPPGTVRPLVEVIHDSPFAIGKR